MKRRVLASTMATMLLAACASEQKAVQVPSGERGDMAAAMPYLRLKIDNSAACSVVSGNQGRLNQQLGSYYVRLGTIYSSRNADPSLPYEARTRWAPVRAIWSEKTGFTLSANISVDSQPTYKATIPLYAASHDSSQQGENFITNLDMIWQNTFIKVQPGSTISVQFDAKFSKAVETGAIGAALRVARVAVGAIAPEAKILTSLNQERLHTEAKLWDTALGQLFGHNSAEQISVVTTPEQVGSGSCGVLTVYAPGMNEDLDPQRMIGEWRVGVNDWRRSLFSQNSCLDKKLDSACAAQVVDELTPVRVLGEPVGAGKTIATFLKEEDIVPLATAETGSNAESQMAGMFCRKLANSLITLGLTDIDAKLGLWAYVMGQPLPGDAAEVLLNTQECKNTIQPFTFATAGTQTTIR